MPVQLSDNRNYKAMTVERADALFRSIALLAVKRDKIKAAAEKRIADLKAAADRELDPVDAELKDMAADMGTSAEFALYTDSGQLLADTDPKLFASIDFSAIRAGGANQRMGAWSVRAAALPLSVMLVRAIDGGLEGALNQWTMLSLCIVFSVALIACILLGYLYAKRHYRPVSRMISILDEEIGRAHV